MQLEAMAKELTPGPPAPSNANPTPGRLTHGHLLPAAEISPA